MSEYTFVVMSNDYPDAAFDDEQSAENYCEHMNDLDKANESSDEQRYWMGRGRIYYRVYKFKTNEPGRIF